MSNNRKMGLNATWSMAAGSCRAYCASGDCCDCFAGGVWAAVGVEAVVGEPTTTLSVQTRCTSTYTGSGFQG